MLKLFVIITIFLSGTLYGQESTREKCGDTATETSKRKPIFEHSKEDISRYFNEHVSFRSEEQLRGIYRVWMNCQGEIYQVDMVKGNLEESVNDEIEGALLKMPKWKPAEYDGAVDYMFYVDFLFKEKELKVNPLMR